MVGRGWGREQKERKGMGEAEKIQENQEGEHAPKSLAMLGLTVLGRGSVTRILEWESLGLGSHYAGN